MSEIPTAGPRGWARAFALTMMIATWAPASGAGDEAAGPAWLRTPLTRGPFAGTLGLDERHLWWGFDGVLPLRSAQTRTYDDRQPLLGLGLAIAGQGGSDSEGLRYTALVDRRAPEKGAWLGASTGGVSQGQKSRLHLATGLWRAIAQVEVEGGVVSSFIEFREREASRWSFYRDIRDTLRLVDTTTYRDVDRSAVRYMAQSALRWHYGGVELSAVGGITLGNRFAPQRWAQATLHLRASRRLLVMAAYGNRPAASMAFDPSARPETMVGVQLAPWASRESAIPRSRAASAHAWLTRPLEDGRTRVQVRCRDASLVELAGDFTDWVPITLTAEGGGRWETTLTIPPGLHEVQIRLDSGPWQVPPGLPSRGREFAGPAGVLLIE